jgi:hypothetical protein
MPNRIIKESICTSCDIERLNWQQEVFWYRLLVQCDDYGRMDARDEILRARCFPLRLEKVSAKDISGFKKALIEIGLIQVYETEGKPFLQVIKWDKHQQIRAKRSKYPAPDINGNQTISYVPVIQSESEKESEHQSEKKNIKEKHEVQPQVFLTTEETEKLIDQFGEDGANQRISALSDGKLAKGYKYKSDYHAILTWARNNGNKNDNGHKPGRDPDKFISGKYGHVVLRGLNDTSLD